MAANIAAKKGVTMPINIPPKKYGCILNDPPWDIEQKNARGAIRHYNLMKLSRIKAMPVADLLAENAHVWLWVASITLTLLVLSCDCIFAAPFSS